LFGFAELAANGVANANGDLAFDPEPCAFGSGRSLRDAGDDGDSDSDGDDGSAGGTAGNQSAASARPQPPAH
jgi:hypothetical protein